MPATTGDCDRTAVVVCAFSGRSLRRRRGTGRRRLRAGGAPVLGVAVASMLALPACTGSSTAAPSSAVGTPSTIPASPEPATTRSVPTTGSPSAGSTVDPAAVETAYRAFWPVLATFQQRPESQWSAVLGQVAVDPQLSFAIAATRQQRRNGITVYGVTVPRAPKVTFGGGRLASVRDCADFSRTGQADAVTRKPRTVGVARTPLSTSLLRGSDGWWRVSNVAFLGGRC